MRERKPGSEPEGGGDERLGVAKARTMREEVRSHRTRFRRGETSYRQGIVVRLRGRRQPQHGETPRPPVLVEVVAQLPKVAERALGCHDGVRSLLHPFEVVGELGTVRPFVSEEQVMSESPGLRVEERLLSRVRVIRRVVVHGEEHGKGNGPVSSQPSAGRNARQPELGLVSVEHGVSPELRETLVQPEREAPEIPSREQVKVFVVQNRVLPHSSQIDTYRDVVAAVSRTEEARRHRESQPAILRHQRRQALFVLDGEDAYRLRRQGQLGKGRREKSANALELASDFPGAAGVGIADDDEMRAPNLRPGISRAGAADPAESGHGDEEQSAKRRTSMMGRGHEVPLPRSIPGKRAESNLIGRVLSLPSSGGDSDSGRRRLEPSHQPPAAEHVGHREHELVVSRHQR